MSNIARRLLSTTSRLAQESVGPSSAPAQAQAAFGLPLDLSSPIPAKHLPRVLQRQIAKQLYLLESTQGSLPSTVNVANPFIVTRGEPRTESEITGKERFFWKRPLISNRRQKQLVQAYPNIDLPLYGTKFNTTAYTHSTESRLKENRDVRWSKDVTIQWTGQGPSRALKQNKRGGKAAEDDGVSKMGVYAGRKKMFKGHKDERNKAQKEADRQARLDGMDQRISKWRQGRTDEKLKNRPSLPF